MGRTCPHCGVVQPETDDAYCTECREDLDHHHHTQQPVHLFLAPGYSWVLTAQAAARQMAAKSATLRDAPPISPPSISGWENRLTALSGLTLPP